MRKNWLVGLGAALGYLLLTLVYCHPAPFHLTTRYLGSRGGDTGIILWDMWYFRHALTVLKDNPLWTDLMYWPYGGNLMLTNDTLFNDAVAYFLSPSIGLAASWNLLFILSSTLAGWAVFEMLKDWGYETAPAFVSGAVFAFCPALTQHIDWGRGLEYDCLNSIPVFFWAFSRVLRDGKDRDAILAALALTWVWTYNYYYFLFCVLLIPFCYAWLERPLRASVSRRRPSVLVRGADAFILLALGLLVVSVSKGQKEFHGAGGAKDLLIYLAPYLAFWSLLALRLAATFKVKIRLERAAGTWTALRPYVVLCGLWAAFNAPMIATNVYFMLSGDYGTMPHPWRGGGNPVDPVWLMTPNLFNPLWREGLKRLIAHLPFGEPNLAGLGLAPLAAAFWLWRRAPTDRWTRLWLACLGFILLLLLGPTLKVLGVHLYLPLPFYFLHLLPLYNNVPTGIYFNVFAMLFLALLFAAAQRELMSRLPRRRGHWVPLGAFALVALEFFSGPRPTFILDFPPLIERLAARPDGAVMPLPTSANFHLITNPGLVGDDWMELSSQMVFAKPRVGGFLPRVAKRVYNALTGDPFFMGLVSAQEGAPPARRLLDRRQVGRYLSQNKIRYVLCDSSRLSPALGDALKRWPMKLIDSEDNLRLYEVGGS